VILSAVVRSRDHTYESFPNCHFGFGVDRCASGTRGHAILFLSGIGLVQRGESTSADAGRSERRLDFQADFICGGLAGTSDLFLDALRRGMKERAQPIAVKKVKVAVSRLGGDATLLGVAWTAIGAVHQQPGSGEQ
jgi:hypothetical protein